MSHLSDVIVYKNNNVRLLLYDHWISRTTSDIKYPKGIYIH